MRFGLALKRLNELNEQRHRQLEVAAEAERESKRALQVAVRRYAEFAARVADGDLTATVAADAQDLRELGESLNTMVGGLAEISTEIQSGVQEIGASTHEILTPSATTPRAPAASPRRSPDVGDGQRATRGGRRDGSARP